MMKNALFVLKIFKFLSLPFGHVEKRFGQKDEVNFKIYDLTTWKTEIAIHILPNISRSKSNQTMKIVPLTEYNIRNIFLEKSYSKCVRENIPIYFL